MKEEKKKIDFYKEIGQYFTADGSFDPVSFSEVFDRHLNRFRDATPGGDDFHEPFSLWLESYISGIADYLKKKNMARASYELIRYAVDKCVGLGINTISIPAEILEDLFSRTDNTTVDLSDDRRRRISADEKRKTIFSAALQVFSEMGFHKATMDMIASIAGMGKGSLYRMFTSKDELLEQLLLEEYRKIVRRFSAIFSPSRDVIEEIQEMIEFWVTYINDNPVVYRLIQNTDLRPEVSEKAHFYRFVAQNLPMLKERIVSLNRDHKVKYLNFESVLFGIFGFIDGVAHKWISYRMEYPLIKEIPVILECVFNGFLSEVYPRRHFCKTVMENNNQNLASEG
ncbi:MAG: TetR/AcrR family transcriptional regulator [Spirochaetes bacterium]|jgi:AcrR family transcriptional regulator|nr:TetR/AcrR family transcriptional regulator [Spirochaetota bacterium]